MEAKWCFAKRTRSWCHPKRAWRLKLRPSVSSRNTVVFTHLKLRKLRRTASSILNHSLLLLTTTQWRLVQAKHWSHGADDEGHGANSPSFHPGMVWMEAFSALGMKQWQSRFNNMYTIEPQIFRQLHHFGASFFPSWYWRYRHTGFLCSRGFPWNLYYFVFSSFGCCHMTLQQCAFYWLRDWNPFLFALLKPWIGQYHADFRLDPVYNCMFILKFSKD